MKNKDKDPHFKKLTVFQVLKATNVSKISCTMLYNIFKNKLMIEKKILNNNNENNSYTEL